MLNYQKISNKPGQIQFWMKMWSLLWNLWLNGNNTKIVKELDFS